MGNVVGNVIGGIGSDHIIRVLDYHTKELGHHSVDDGKISKDLWR